MTQAEPDYGAHSRLLHAGLELSLPMLDELVALCVEGFNDMVQVRLFVRVESDPVIVICIEHKWLRRRGTCEIQSAREGRYQERLRLF